MKTILYHMAVIVLLSSFVGASCFNESNSSEDLEIGSQLIDVFVCKGIEVKDSIPLILPAFYFILIIAFISFIILLSIFVFNSSKK